MPPLRWFAGVAAAPFGLGLALGIAAFCSSAQGAVVVVANQTEKPVAFTAVLPGEPNQAQSLPVGEIAVFHTTSGMGVDFVSQAKHRRYQLDPNAVFAFVASGERLDLKQITFSRSVGGISLHIAAGQSLPAPVAIPVKIVADEDQPANREVWEQQLRRQLAEASAFFERLCRVRFEVVAVEEWDSDDGRRDLGELLSELRQEVPSEPAGLVVGMTSQVEVKADTRLPMVATAPLAGPILLPSAQEAFREGDQLELLVHQLGHFLGAVHSPEPGSVMRPVLRGGGRPPAAGPLKMDAVNALAVNLLGESIRSRHARTLAEVPRATRWHLFAIYSEILRSLQDSDTVRTIDLVRGPTGTRERFLAGWDDGTQTTGEEAAPWADAGAQPQLAGRSLFQSDPPVRWLEDVTLSQPAEPAAYVEFFGGDRLPGAVTAGGEAVGSQVETLPPHLVVVPQMPFNRPSGPERSDLRVSTAWIRRIVWQPVADEMVPGSLFYRDGRQMAFRVCRFESEGARVLGDDGLEEIPYSAIGEIHMPAIDPWQAYVEQVGALAPDGQVRLMTLDTVDGLRATSSEARFEAEHHGGDKPENWYHRLQPAWSFDPLWIPHRRIAVRRYARPNEVPLSLLTPSAVKLQPELAGQWRLVSDRNVLGGVLQSGGQRYFRGLGVQGRCELRYDLPASAQSFRVAVALDDAAGTGGCARGTVAVEGAGSQTLYTSPLMVGASEPLDTGVLPLSPQPGQRLVLSVDSVHAGRPPGADPFDVRDLFNWLDPRLTLAQELFRGELASAAPRQVPAWNRWTVEAERADRPLLVNYWCDVQPQRPRYRLASCGGLTLRGTVNVSPQKGRLLVVAGRPQGCPGSRIEVRVDGEKLSDFAVSPQQANRAVEPQFVSLAAFHGRSVALAIVQHPDDADRSLVDWEQISLVPSESAAETP